MRICHLTSVHPSDDVRIFHKECVSLAKAGFETHLVAPDATQGEVHGVHVWSVDQTAGGRIARMTKTVNAVYQMALELNTDVYHLHDPELLRIAGKLKAEGKIVIYDAHEDLPKQIMNKHWVPVLVRKPVSRQALRYENKVASVIDCVVCATPAIGNRFMNVNQRTVVVNNYPMLNEVLDVQASSNEQHEVCYTGGISKERGLTQLVQALDGTSIRLNLAGRFSDPTYRDELVQIPGWENVNELGWLGRGQLSEILARSRVGIVTFLPFPNHLEAQPNKLFEYMAAQLPVIASGFPLWQQIVDEAKCGVTVDPLDPRAIATALKDLLSDDARARKMGRSGRNAIEQKYNWEIEEQTLLALYTSL